VKSFTKYHLQNKRAWGAAGISRVARIRKRETYKQFGP